jgi:anti-sigma regulatory factor (Ser/Thr protein kinase)
MQMDEPQEYLHLDSRLTELSRVRPWMEALAERYGLSEQLRFAIHLCLEEVLANVVLHGYRGEPGRPIDICSWVSEGALYFAVDDEAPLFVPVDPIPQADSTEIPSLESIQPGGNGIHLLHRFAGTVDYERRPKGNRLKIGFALPV